MSRAGGRAVVTGLGVIAPSGIGTQEHWATVRAGQVRVRPVEGWDTTTCGVTLGGQVDGFKPEDHVDERLLVQTDRWTWMSLAASRMALADAAYDPAEHDPYATSVALAAGSGGNEFGQREMTGLYGRGPKAVTTYQSIAWFYAASTGQASIWHGTKGPASVLVSEGAGGLDSIGHARRVVRRGTPTVLAGGTEAGLSPYALACQAVGGRLTPGTTAAEGYRPFDVRADGYAPGEGGAVLVVEDAAAALERGAPQVYGEVAGYAATHDAESVTAPATDSRQLARAMGRALADAGVTPDDVDLVIADAAGVPALDAVEVRALQEVFGARTTPVPVAAPQGLVGRLSVGGSALSAATALLSIRDGVLPAVGNLHEPVPAAGLELVREAREGRVEVVLVNARGLGGFNSSMVLRRWVPEGTA
ncbi:beta-ketoacyl synthase N-terminal-like domain-containing protein [Quadrisphaera sp. DSM 44207]|uniref:beta-ketoacyl synthase N-terminal-like domain-containing protein n=1 Tax=Quadrisphaera sp. DSM 44207 TaxID=1881057 RepID=UPI00088B0133|nr:beta-ketoacyl synthase N-terminal-like domain-containing protein [Quadrisphaera sp. DSM 44207]SDQ09800.1 minimal PKS chain-length factor (CLF/KS beta) [Quadrisphaera sp. DSM 44207]